MRGLIDGLPSPHPLGAALPALYQDDGLAQRLTEGLDVVMAPIFNVLDNLGAYLDASLSPADFLPWLAGWAGITFDQSWPEERRRGLLASAAELEAWSGTRRGLMRAVALLTGVEPEVDEPGGATWSASAHAPAQAPTANHIMVRVRVADPAKVDQALIDRLVTSAKPAHLTHSVEVSMA